MARKMALMDWRAMKYYHVRGILLPIMVVIIGLFSSPLLVIPTCVLLFVFFSMNTFAVEEKGALNNLYLTLQVDRNSIVSGRYILAGIMGFCGVAAGIPIMVIINSIGWSQYHLPASWYIFILAVSYLLFSLFTLVIYPVLFKLGYTKGKFWGLVLPAIFMGLLYGIFVGLSRMPGNEMLLLNVLEYAYENMLWVSGGITAVATLLLVASFTVSRRIYSKRDF